VTQPIPDELQQWMDENAGAEEVTEEMNASNPFRMDDYEPVFDREGLERRTLTHITDEEHYTGAPRNTPTEVGRFMVNDPATPAAESQEDVDAAFAQLEMNGLIEQRDDGSYVLTRDGWVEMSN
jgi:hypothetical protein